MFGARMLDRYTIACRVPADPASDAPGGGEVLDEIMLALGPP